MGRPEPRLIVPASTMRYSFSGRCPMLSKKAAHASFSLGKKRCSASGFPVAPEQQTVAPGSGAVVLTVRQKGAVYISFPSPESSFKSPHSLSLPAGKAEVQGFRKIPLD